MELFAALVEVEVDGDALDGTDLGALGFIEVADAFGATVGVDDVVLGPHGDGFVGAFGFAAVAVDALVGDDEGHVSGSPCAVPAGA